jgi:hypothetical protein
MPGRTKPPSQNWRAFLENHVGDLASIDFFTMPTVMFRGLFVLIVLAHDRRKIVHFKVTEHPAAEWTALEARVPPSSDLFRGEAAACCRGRFSGDLEAVRGRE